MQFLYAPVDTNAAGAITLRCTVTCATGEEFDMAWAQPWTWIGTTNGTGAQFVTAQYQTAATLNVQQVAPPSQAILQQQRERRERRQRADARGYALLDLLLDAEQRESLSSRGCFVVVAPSGNRYRLTRGRHAGNITMWDPATERWCGTLCVHISPRFPDGDNLAAQLLAITTNEADFLCVANLQDGYRPPGVNRVLEEQTEEIVVEVPEGVTPEQMQQAVRDVARDVENGTYAMAD